MLHTDVLSLKVIFPLNVDGVSGPVVGCGVRNGDVGPSVPPFARTTGGSNRGRPRRAFEYGRWVLESGSSDTTKDRPENGPVPGKPTVFMGPVALSGEVVDMGLSFRLASRSPHGS